MSGNNYLLDTNIVTAILNREQGVEENIRNNLIYISSTVLGELYFGAKNSSQQERNLQKIEVLITRCTILNCDQITANFYSDIRLALKKKGRPIPENDIWIAAVAQQHNLTLVTRDSDFQYVDNLQVVKW